MKFVKAKRQKARLRLALTGPSGSGKTFGALTIARSLGGKIAVIDTEKGSASLYSHLADFDVLELDPPYSPERFMQAVQMAEQAGYDTVVIDSITHEWSGPGGCLEMVDAIAKAKYRGNSWSAWNDVTPRHRAFVDALLRSPLHVIATTRSKTETAQTEENGRKKVVKLGMKTEQRDGIEYEFTVVLDLTHDGHFAVASKDRTGLFAGDPRPITDDTGRALLAWLNEGDEAPAPATTPVVDERDDVPVEDEDYAKACRLIDKAQDVDTLTQRWAAIEQRFMHDPDTLDVLCKRKDGRLALFMQAPESGKDDAAYAAYKAAVLPRLEDAARQGTDKLRHVRSGLEAGPMADRLWKEHRAALIEQASDADQNSMIGMGADE